MEYTCPYCQNSQILQGRQLHNGFIKIYVDRNIEEDIGFLLKSITCANPSCARTALSGKLTQAVLVKGNWQPGNVIESWALRPQGSARPLPGFIPQAIAEDYTEACRIRDLSPKASATLIRRCLQGMIRDFCGIAKPTLDREIKTLRQMVDDGTAPKGVSDESVDAIDQIRAIGNIGAHMEKDIDLIIPVEADEAQLLIELTEMLFDEWYIAREKREARLAALRVVADNKRELRVTQLPAPDEG